MSISPDQFLNQPSDPDEDDGTYMRDQHGEIVDPFANDLFAPTAIESIAGSLATIAASFGANAELEDERNTLREETADLHDKYAALFGLVADVEKLVSKSTSKLALSVRDAITLWKTGTVVAAAPEIDDEGAHGVNAALAATRNDVDPHNHAWDADHAGNERACVCGAWIDESDPDHPNGIVREPGYESDPNA